MYVALTSNHNENYITKFSPGDTVYSYYDPTTKDIIDQPFKCKFIDYQDTEATATVQHIDGKSVIIPTYLISPYYPKGLQSMNKNEWPAWYEMGQYYNSEKDGIK